MSWRVVLAVVIVIFNVPIRMWMYRRWSDIRYGIPQDLRNAWLTYKMNVLAPPICARLGHQEWPGWRIDNRGHWRDGICCNRCGEHLRDVGKPYKTLDDSATWWGNMLFHAVASKKQFTVSSRHKKSGRK